LGENEFKNEKNLDESQPRNRTKLKIKIGVVSILILVVIGFCYWWFFKRNKVTTDNAYVMADTARISSRIPGTVLKVFVENDQWVEKGQVLVKLDPADYKVRVDEAKASLEEIEARIKESEISISLVDSKTEAQVKSAEAAYRAAKDKEREIRHKLVELQKKRLSVLADYKHIKRDYERFESLYKGGASSGRQRDKARTAYKKIKAGLAAIDADIASVKASIDALGESVKNAEAQLAAAKSERARVLMQKNALKALKARRDSIKAKLQAAELNLSYCTIKAPISGYISQKSVQVGESVQPGLPLMAVVPLKDVYIEANYKETQLENVRIGQPATIKADIYPGYKYSGKVVGIRAGTGAAFSLLPPENATGNWIKVVQRVPVKIELNSPPPDDHPLRVGLSLEVTIDTSKRDGRFLAERANQK